jgi:hypothetical protein
MMDTIVDALVGDGGLVMAMLFPVLAHTAETFALSQTVPEARSVQYCYRRTR